MFFVVTGELKQKDDIGKDIQQTSGKISKDDVNGFSSYSDLCVMAKTYTVTYLHQFTPCNYNSKDHKIIVTFFSNVLQKDVASCKRYIF